MVFAPLKQIKWFAKEGLGLKQNGHIAYLLQNADPGRRLHLRTRRQCVLLSV